MHKDHKLAGAGTPTASELELLPADGVAVSSAIELSFDSRGGRRSIVFTEKAPIIAGRHATCSIRIDAPTVARCHAVIGPRGDWWLIRDLASRYGTRLNGARLRSGAPRVLSNGDRLEFGGSVVFSVRVVWPEADECENEAR